MVQKLRLIMFSLNVVDCSVSFLSLSTWTFFDGQIGLVCGGQHFSVNPFGTSVGFELGWTGLGLGGGHI